MSDVATAVEHEVQEALKFRGGNSGRIPMKRLPDGKFAPRGTGQVLTAGSKLSVPHKSESGKSVSATMGSGGKAKLDDGPDAGKSIDVRFHSIDQARKSGQAPSQGKDVHPDRKEQIAKHGASAMGVAVAVGTSGTVDRTSTGYEVTPKPDVSIQDVKSKLKRQGYRVAQVGGKLRVSVPGATAKAAKERRDSDMRRAAQEAAMGVETAVTEVLEAERDKSAGDSHRNIKCPECGLVQSATHSKCSRCGHDLADARKAKMAKGTNVSEAVVQEATDSPKVPLANKPGKTNWVEKYNALPKGSWIRRAAEHLQGKGMAEGRAIATAKNAAAKLCASGDLNFPGVQQANAGSRAEACAAVAKWDAARAKAKASKVSEAALWFELVDDPRNLSVQEHRLLAGLVRDTELCDSFALPVQEATEPKGQREGDMPKVTCPKCNHKMKPTEAGKCSNCGHDVKQQANVASRMRGKSKSVSEAVQEAVEASLA